MTVFYRVYFDKIQIKSDLLKIIWNDARKYLDRCQLYLYNVIRKGGTKLLWHNPN